jgi:hypothetical protein
VITALTPPLVFSKSKWPTSSRQARPGGLVSRLREVVTPKIVLGRSRIGHALAATVTAECLLQ